MRYETIIFGSWVVLALVWVVATFGVKWCIM